VAVVVVCCSLSRYDVEILSMLAGFIASYCQHYHGVSASTDDPTEAQVFQTNGRMTESTFVVGSLGHQIKIPNIVSSAPQAPHW
jgi:hypothetical protein